MKAYVIISTTDHNSFHSVIGVFYTEEDAIKYMDDNKNDKWYYESWEIVESEVYPVTNIL